MIKIEFYDPELMIKKEDMTKTDYRALFKVFHKRKGYIYDPAQIPIKEIILDANIYDEDYVFPPDYL